MGATAGFIGALVMAILIYLLHLFGVDVRLITAISQVFVRGPLVGTFQGNTIGLIAHFLCGSIIGIGILIVLEITGYTHPILKGASLGGAVWFITCGIIARILSISMRGDFSGTLFNFLIHIVYGIIATSIITNYHNRIAAHTDDKSQGNV